MNSPEITKDGYKIRLEDQLQRTQSMLDGVIASLRSLEQTLDYHGKGTASLRKRARRLRDRIRTLARMIERQT